MTFQAFKNFFAEHWAPKILKIHQPSGDVISTFIGDLSVALEHMPTHKVGIMFYSYICIHPLCL